LVTEEAAVMQSCGRFLGVCASVLAAALALGACGSSDSGASGATSTSAGSSAVKKPAKAPIEIGIINQERAPDASFPEFTAGAKSAVQYVNNDLGGVAGHPIALKICTTDASPASSSNCASEMVSDKVIATTQSIDYGASASLPLLDKAGIPMLGGEPLTPAEFTAKRAAYFVGGASATVPALFTFAVKNLKAKTVGIMYPEGVGGAAAIQLAQSFLKPLGVKAVTASDPATAPDFTASVTKMAKTDAIVLMYPQQACSRIMAAHKQLGIKAPLVMPAVCTGKDVLAAGQGGAVGSYFSGEFKAPNSKGDADVDAFRKALTDYPVDKADPNAIYTQMGFSNIVNITRLLQDVAKAKGDGAITSAALWDRVKSTTDEPNFMAPPYGCAKPPLGKNAPTACQVGQIFFKYDGQQMQDATAGQFIDISKPQG
jgi:branched-chain amino acid transport system substrate-binding protein